MPVVACGRRDVDDIRDISRSRRRIEHEMSASEGERLDRDRPAVVAKREPIVGMESEQTCCQSRGGI